MKELSKIISLPLREHLGTIIWLHGLGGKNYEFCKKISNINLSNYIKYIFPQAPMQSVSCMLGLKTSSWYNIILKKNSILESYKDILKNSDLLRNLIEEEYKLGMPYHRIFISGFSQGGAMSLYTGLTHTKKLGGIIGISTYLPVFENLNIDKSPANYRTPILMIHGKKDIIIDYKFGRKSYMRLKKWNYKAKWYDFPFGHIINNIILSKISTWMFKIIKYM